MGHCRRRGIRICISSEVAVRLAVPQSQVAREGIRPQLELRQAWSLEESLYTLGSGAVCVLAFLSLLPPSCSAISLPKPGLKGGTGGEHSAFKDGDAGFVLTPCSGPQV